MIKFIVKSFSLRDENNQSLLIFLGLPSPAPTPPENDVRTTPKRERKLLANKNKLNLQKRSQSPMAAGKKLSPIYMDLAYVPHHGNSYYTHVEFFKKIRARYYVFSGTEPSKEVYNALLEAKQTWEDKNLGKTEAVTLMSSLIIIIYCRSHHYSNIRHRRPWLLGFRE